MRFTDIEDDDFWAAYKFDHGIMLTCNPRWGWTVINCSWDWDQSLKDSSSVCMEPTTL